MTDGANLTDALALEKVEFERWVSNAASESDAEVKALERQLAAKGLYHSGARYTGEIEIRFAKMGNAVTENAIAKRKELGRRVPELLAATLLEQLRIRLHQYVDGVAEGHRNRVSTDPDAADALSAAINPQVERKAAGLKVKITQEIEALRLEARLGMHAEENAMTFSLTNSTIASLNLGAVFGDLTASIQTLNQTGQKERGELIQRVTEAIATSTALQYAQRKELLEHLSVVSTEVAFPPEKRKMGPLRSSIAFLRHGLTAVAQLETLWPAMEQLLKSTGILDTGRSDTLTRNVTAR